MNTRTISSDRGIAGREIRRVFSAGPNGHPSRRRSTCFRSGFTLVEVMIAVVVFLMITIGVYTALIKSYQLAALSRCRDEARAVLRTYVDQFERLSTTTDYTEDSEQKSATRWLFIPTSGDSRGLEWPGLSDKNTGQHPIAGMPGTTITLGGADSAHAVTATVTRDVTYVDAKTGEDSTTQTIAAAGYMLRGTFRIQFTLNGKVHSQSLSVLRVVK